MQIFWHGLSSIRVEAKTADTEATLLTDPYSNETGLRFPRTLQPDLLVLSHQDRKQFNLEGVEGSPFIISDPGEYEVKGIFVHGVQDPTQGTEDKRPLMYRFNAEGISLAFLGGLKRALTPFEVEQLGDIDILLLPVGGEAHMDPKTAVDTINIIEPRMVIPLCYDIEGLKDKLGTVDAFMKQLGGAKREDANKLKIAKKDLPAEDVIVTVLERA